VGSIAGIVGAGGNVGAMLIGFLFKSMPYSTAFLYLGASVFVVGLIVMAVKLLSLQNAGKQVNAETQDIGGSLAV
jgi:NNP family nitrate/nitrite transporter-like MFS transporter